MKTIELKKDLEYLYTAGLECVKVKYLHSTSNGYLFTDGKVENELTKLSVENFIEKTNKLCKA